MSVHYVPAKRPPTPDIMGAMLEAKVAPEQIELESIQTNGGTQMRAALNAETVGEYMQTLRDSDQAWPFPPVTVYYDGETYWLGDGFHRVAAARQIGRTGSIPAEIRAGTRREAVLYAAGANANHGLRRTNADKRQAVETLLRDEEWAKWSDSEIARRCAVDHKTVGNIRKELAATWEIPKSDTRVGADGRTINTANIGASQPASGWQNLGWASVNDLEMVVRQARAEFYRDENELRHACNDMRAAARTGAGGFWSLIIQHLGVLAYRKNTLCQAINNVAAQMEAQANGTNAQASTGSRTDIGSRPLAADEAERQAGIASQPAATALTDLPVVATTSADTPARLEPVAPMPAMLLKGNLRRWLGERYNAYFTYQMLDNWMKQAALADLEDFTATLPAGWTQDALDQAIRELHAHFAPDEDDAPAEPVISLDELEVVSSATGPTGWTDPEPEHELDSYDEESPTVAARRMNKLHMLKVRFSETIDLLKDFGELTGRHIATLAVGRELANLIDILEAEMDGLQKGINNHA